MLYVTTRNNQDVFTAQRTLHDNRGPDGGFFVPFHHPVFTATDISDLSKKPFNQCVADVLNLLIGTKLTGWDIDFSIGRYPIRMAPLHHRIYVAENWHNPQWCYARLERCLVSLLGIQDEICTDWLRIVIRVAVLFGTYGELLRSEWISAHDKIDISVISGDFSVPMSVKYAQLWGLPIGNIVCCCNENGELWNLICHGQLRTGAVSMATETPLADVALPEGLERLIYDCFGVNETLRYLECCRTGHMYCVDDAALLKLRESLYVSVVSSRRVQETIPNMYGTSGYIMSPYAALAYSGLQDYRVKQKESRHAVVLSDFGPIYDAKSVSDALGVSEEALLKLV